MSKMAQENVVEEDEIDIDDVIADMHRRMDEMQAKMEACLKSGPQPSQSKEIKELKEEVALLKKENASLKQQIKDLWESFSSFFEKQSSKVSDKWNSFFAKSKPSEADSATAENTNNFKL